MLILSFVQLGVTSKDIDDIWNPETRDTPQPSRYTLYTYYPVAAIIFSSLMVIKFLLIDILRASLHYKHQCQGRVNAAMTFVT